MWSRFLHRSSLARIGWLSYFVAWVAYFAFFWSRSLYFNPQGDLVAGHINMWGDWAAHFTMGSTFAYRSLWTIDSPLFYGARLSYPFFVNWISGGLVRLGIPFVTAFVVPSFIFSVLTVVSLLVFFQVLLRSRKLAVLASLIFLLNGGVGFAYYLQDVAYSPRPLFTALNPSRQYTKMEPQHIKWISVIDSMIIPQRAFTMGFPLGLLAVSYFYVLRRHFLEKKFTWKQFNWLKWLTICAIVGVLPIIHMHSFLALFVILGSWAASDMLTLRRKAVWVGWTISAAMIGVIALPIFLTFFVGQISGGHFLTWYPGWLAREWHVNWLVFWFRNWTVVPLLAFAGATWWVRRRPTTHRWFAFTTVAPFFMLFALSNLFIFQPWPWDNTKLLVWVAVGFASMTAVFLDLTWQKIHQLFAQHPVQRVVLQGMLSSLFVLIIFAGTLDAYWCLRHDLHSFTLYSHEELELAAWVKQNTPATSLWLTDTNHNHWLYNLTGRQTLMAYPGWLWSHGYPYQSREGEVRQMLSSPPVTETQTKYPLDFVAIERAAHPMWEKELVANDAHFQLRYESPRYLIYQLVK